MLTAGGVRITPGLARALASGARRTYNQKNFRGERSPMSPYRRNVLVGLTTVASLAVLAWMIIQFGGQLAAPFAGKKIPIRFVADRADGINAGSRIQFLGTHVGTVTNVQLDTERNNVRIDAELEAKYALPSNVRGDIRLPNLLGAGAIIELTLTDASPSPARIKADDEFPATYSGVGIIPPEISQLAAELKLAVTEFRQSGLLESLRSASDNLDRQLTSVGKTFDSINQVVGDPAVQDDLRAIIARAKNAVTQVEQTSAKLDRFVTDLNALPGQASELLGDARAGISEIREGVGEAREAIADVRDEAAGLSKRLDENMNELQAILADARSIAKKIDSGNGTAARLVNDPKLYETLIQATEVLTLTLEDVRRLSRQVEEEGFKIKLW